MKRDTIIAELENHVSSLMSQANALRDTPKDKLNARPEPTSWSILECLEHMNRYSEFYIPEIRKKIKKAKASDVNTFNPGWLGNKSAMSMLPEDTEVQNKMKTFKSKNPSLDHGVRSNALEQFIKDQKELLNLLNKAKYVNLGKVKTKTTLPLIKFKLGDTLRFYIYHEVRHALQIKKTRAQLQCNEPEVILI